MKKWFSELSLLQKIPALVGTALLVIVLFGLWMYYPVLRNAGTSHGYACTRVHIYIPVRLDFRGCKTVTGVVARIKVEKDGDIHVRLLLDTPYNSLLTSQNYKHQGGNLVVEDMCRRIPADAIEILAKLACLHYKSPFPIPLVGKHYEVTGNYVVDDWHGGWAEIHGLSELKRLN